jgi:lipopolysaccharide heptosyltransferase II
MLHTLAGTVPPPSRNDRTPPDGPRILFIRPDHMGDLLFATPSLRALRQSFPCAHITALVGPWGATVLSDNPHVDEVLTLSFPGFSRLRKASPWQPYRTLHQWAKRLRGNYHLAFIQRFDHWWGALLTYLADVPERVGYAIPEVAPFLSHVVPYESGRHEVEQNMRLVRAYVSGLDSAGDGMRACSPTNCPIEYRIPKDDAAWTDIELGEAAPITIHPGAGASIKLWLVDRWAKVADTLARETGGQIVLTGSKEERVLCEAIADRVQTDAWVLAGQTTLKQLAVILSKSRLVLGLDSGPLHLAVAMGAPTVQLYGPVDAKTFGPWGAPERHRVLVSDWPCIPCNRLDYAPKELVNHPCVREIDVKSVLEAARQALAV